MKEPKTILITGASSGIGKALALAYAAPNKTLLLLGRNPTRLEEIASACKAKHATVVVATIDVRHTEDMKEWLITQFKQHPFDLVIANAGISGGTSGQGVNSGESEEQARTIFDINVNGLLNSILPIITLMKQRKKGQIALMSSMAGFRGLPSAPAYSASKACVKSYGEALRGALLKDNIEVSVICPGYVKTPLTDVNRFPMPFLMSAEKAAQIIKKKLRKNRSRIAFPLRMYVLVWILHILPLWITDPLFAKLPKK